MKRGKLLLGLVAVAATAVLLGCGQQKAEPVKTVSIPAGEIEPAVWGKAYPTQYEMWKSTDQPTPAGKSVYKKGWDADKITWDKLSEYPYLAIMFNGWGFGIDYNEPRGHAYMMIDQKEADPSRTKAGGVCLSCKSPYASGLQKAKGKDYYLKPYAEMVAAIPEKHRDLGVACIDCHDNNDMSLKLSRDFSLVAALKDMGKDPETLTRQEKRSLVCAQCHVTYNIPKDKDMKSVGLFFPWQNSKWGAITVEDVIKKIRSDDAYREWTQKVTGFKMGFIRHPEFEFYSNNSVHFKAGAACADCHMPFTKVGVNKVSDHRVMSPLKADFKACVQCHTEGTEWLKGQVVAIQERTVAMLNRSGYGTATVIKLFEAAHKAKAEGKVIDQALYDQAKDYYEEAFYRNIYIGAENSVGFHNPTEALRNLGDSVAFAGKAEALLRQALAKAGVDVPIKVDLELAKYLDNRGEKKLMFKPDQELKDPTRVQERFQATSLAK
jgi:nitrite reductase (cytochrome c-552)